MILYKHDFYILTYYIMCYYASLILVVHCQMEQDSTWRITWPAAQRGEVAVQQCPGNG